jgi:hypothetical protein
MNNCLAGKYFHFHPKKCEKMKRKERRKMDEESVCKKNRDCWRERKIERYIECDHDIE